MKKALHYGWVILKYVSYQLQTTEERMRYEQGLYRGAHCHKMDREGLFNQTLVFYYLPGVEPQREFLNWEEFLQAENKSKQKKA